MTAPGPKPARAGGPPPDEFRPRPRLRRVLGAAFAALCLAAVLLAVGVLALVLGDLARDGAPALSAQFLTGYPSRIPARAGIRDG